VQPRTLEPAEARDHRLADESFDALTAELLVERTRVTAWIGVTLFPAFGFLDLVAYPDQAGRFLWWRLACALVMVGVALATRRPLGRWRPLPAYAAYLSVGLTIAAMVYDTGGQGSPYYVGLCMVALTVVLVMPWSTRHTAGTCALLYAAYVAPAPFFPSSASVGVIATSHFFLLTSALLAAIGTHLGYKSRRRQFDLTWTLDRRSKELAHANERLRELDAAKARFFANVSHELRTPLTLMLTPLESALERTMNPELRGELGTFQAAATRLSTLIDDLLDIAEIDSGGRKLRKAPLRLDLLADEVVRAAKPFAHEHSITLQLRCAPDLPAAMLDRSAMEQILYNLVSNALKFTPAGGRVEVGVEEDASGLLRAWVEDTGLGIPAERLATVFERFGHNTETVHAKGSGLGLSLVKEHAEAHGGSVAVHSDGANGTRFEVLLPLGGARTELLCVTPNDPDDASLPGARRRPMSFASALAERNSAHSVRNAEREDHGDADAPTVLVVDDDPQMRSLVARSLADAYRIVEAPDGRAALRAFAEFDPDVIVSDIGMPVMDGIEMCRRLRREPGGDRVPLLFLTARAGDDPRLQGLEEGANDYLTKPFSKRELRARVRNFAQLRKTQRRLAGALSSERQARDELVRSEKLAGLGKMAIEVGHEINNPLNFVLGYAQRLQRDADRVLGEVNEQGATPSEALARFPDLLERIVDGGLRIKRIVQALRSLSAKPCRALGPVDVDQEVDAIVRLFEGDLPPGVVIDRVPGPGGRVLAPSTGIGQVVTNLLSNAIKAVEPTATPAEPLTITVATAPGEDGRSLTIVVRDPGCGMDARTAEQVFDAFFTTRTSGEGLGVGMALVRSIVTQDIGGAIDFDSAPGRGTEMRVTLPLADFSPGRASLDEAA